MQCSRESARSLGGVGVELDDGPGHDDAHRVLQFREVFSCDESLKSCHHKASTLTKIHSARQGEGEARHAPPRSCSGFINPVALSKASAWGCMSPYSPLPFLVRCCVCVSKPMAHVAASVCGGDCTIRCEICCITGTLQTWQRQRWGLSRQRGITHSCCCC